MIAAQLDTEIQVTGYAIPLNQMEFTLTGATPLTSATSLLTTAELTAKLAAFSAAIWEAMLSCAWVIHVFIAAGLSTLRPFARKALYLASIVGPLLAISSGPLTSSCKARQYMR